MKKRVAVVFTVLAAFGAVAGLVAGSAVGQPVQLTSSLAGGGEGQDPNGSGGATLSFDAAAGTVCFDLTWSKISGPFAAHIHVGAAGQAGDIAVHLFDMKDGTPLAGTIKGVSGCARNVDDTLIGGILADPDGYYVNVHNARFPGGAIRGQLGGSGTPTTTPSGMGSPYPRAVD